MKKLSGAGWVVSDNAVYAPKIGASHLEACRKCAEQALAGNENAITALLVCNDDAILHHYVSLVRKEHGQ